MTDATPLLHDAAEARVLDCLFEKEATTPEQYPLTENAALQAANQKTSREAVMARSERLHRYADADDLAHALERLAAGEPEA